GTYLLVKPDGKKYWRLKYQLDGKERLYSLGVFPKITLEAAIVARDSARALIRKRIHPIDAKRGARAKAATAQAIFQLGLAVNGGLIIETDTNALTLTLPQTQALAAFFAAINEHKKESE